MESARNPEIHRVVLIGFMGAGKTSVGRELARKLGWAFRDFDDAVETEVGRPIPEIFRDRGEAFFRRVEARVGRRLLDTDEVVLATGGGWGAAPGRLDALPPGTLSVWLRVSAEEAVRRVRNDATARPLLDAPDPVERARELLDEREPHYSEAHLVLDAESAPPEGLAETILESMRVSGARKGATHAESGGHGS